MNLPSIFHNNPREMYDELFLELCAHIGDRPVKMREDSIDLYFLLLCTAMWNGVVITSSDIISAGDKSECYVIHKDIKSLNDLIGFRSKTESCFTRYYTDDLIWINTNDKKIVSLNSTRMNILILMDQLYKLFTDVEPHLDFEYSLLCKSPQDLEAKALDEGWLK